jgi:hypothetical protein
MLLCDHDGLSIGMPRKLSSYQGLKIRPYFLKFDRFGQERIQNAANFRSQIQKFQKNKKSGKYVKN